MATSISGCVDAERWANIQVFLTALSECSETRNLQKGKQLHAEAVECRQICNIYLANALMNMYAKCGSMVDAREVFDSMNHLTVVSWNVLIFGYADNGQGLSALDMFVRMRAEGPVPDSLTLVAALKACTSLAAQESASRWAKIGKSIHNLAVQNGCSIDNYVQNSLIDMFRKCGNMVYARGVFDGMKHSDVVTWNSLILGYAENGQGHNALNTFTWMRSEGPAPVSATLVAALKACSSLATKGGIREGNDRVKEIHNLTVENGCSTDVHLQCTLVDMYAKCNSMADARQVFDSMKHQNVVAWTALILGYADNDQGHIALQMLTRMRTEGPAPNWVTLVAALKACTSLAIKGGARRWTECRNKGKEWHNFAVLNGWNSHIYVQSTLVDMYAKCGSMVDAREVFDNVNHPNVVSWTALILGYADNGQGHMALVMFTKMRSDGLAPNSVTFGAALKACGSVGALEFGRRIHSEIDNGNEVNVVLVNCLVDFYAKCGSLAEAQDVFDSHAETRNLITWTALLAGFSSCGDSEVVFRLFEKMQDAGLRPDAITLVCILTCCSHASLFLKGKECFDGMSTKYGVTPTVEHYNCMIDLLGRANKLDDAMIMLEGMPYTPTDVTWTSILSACRKWKNVDIARVAFQSLIDLNDRDATPYVLMGQIYGSVGMVQEQGMLMGKFRAYKKQGETCWTNEAGDVHSFVVGNNQHPQKLEIRERWEFMSLVMRQHGYTTNFLSFNHEKENLCGHSERLAVVCALINTQNRKTITIVKNLKVCEDCHTIIAIISQLECRRIIFRDTNRIHTFEDGKCSCGNYW